jgi:hypothetical protein
MEAKEQFEKSNRDYNKMLRWQEAEAAALNFVDKANREEYLARVEAAKEVKIADYRIKTVECDTVTGVAKVKVEIDYYIPPAVVMKSLVDHQEWIYVQEGDTKNWRLKSLYPEFK